MRRGRAVLLALVLAVVLIGLHHRRAMVIVPSVCAMLDPNVNWFLWWYYGCGDGDQHAAGGGSSGAGD